MNLKKQYFAEMFRNDYYTVEVTFDSSNPEWPSYNKHYTYKVPKTTSLALGDKVVVFVDVKIPNRSGSTLQVVTVRKIHDAPEIHADNGFKYKWIVGKRDDVFANYDANVARDERLKIAVNKLQAALDSVELKKRISEAFTLLDSTTAKELRDAFGEDLPAALADSNA